jgi:hypothetical protein
VSAGPAWTWKRWVRVLAACVFAHTSGRNGAGDAHVLPLRPELQL